MTSIVILTISVQYASLDSSFLEKASSHFSKYLSGQVRYKESVYPYLIPKPFVFTYSATSLILYLPAEVVPPANARRKIEDNGFPASP